MVSICLEDGTILEIIAAVRDNDNDNDAMQTSRYLELPIGLVHAAIRCYGTCRDEINHWIEAHEHPRRRGAYGLAGRARGRAAVR